MHCTEALNLLSVALVPTSSCRLVTITIPRAHTPGKPFIGLVEPLLWPLKGKAMTRTIEGSNRPTSYLNSNTSLRYFWDGGLLANTPLSQTYIAHIDYWRRVRKLEDNIPSLRFSIINLHPAKQEYLPTDYDGVVDRRNDIIYHDRTEFDENIAALYV